jgi:hypothetical protein
MKMFKKISGSVLGMIAGTATVMISTAQAQASVVARDESLPSPNGAKVYYLRVPDLFGDSSPVGLNLRSLSYLGGMTWESPNVPGGAPIRNVVSSGGFETLLTLSNSIGNVVSQVGRSGNLSVTPGDYKLTVSQYSFGARPGQFVGYTDIYGAGRENRFTVEANTISDYLSNSVKVTTNGGNITAILEPQTNGIFNDLFDLAKFGGFNHFNWLNIVEDKNPLAMLEPFGPSVGSFDPARGGNTPIQPFDEYKWYFDESPANSPNLWSSSKYYKNNNTQAWWTDNPKLAIPGASITFTTYLAGVRGGDYGTIFANVDGNSFENLAFKWKYTQGFSNGSVSLNSLFANTDPSLGGGGIVEFLGFLQPEDWTQDRITRLQEQGVLIAGLNSPGTSPNAVAVPGPSFLTGLIIAGVGLLYKKKFKQ